jgi:hypothetical protein
MKPLLTLILLVSFSQSKTLTEEDKKMYRENKKIVNYKIDSLVDNINGFSGITILNMTSDYEYIIKDILHGSPSYLSGVKVDDELMSVNGEYVENVKHGYELLHSAESSDIVNIQVKRKRFLRSEEYLNFEFMLSPAPSKVYLKNAVRQYYSKRSKTYRKKKNIFAGIAFISFFVYWHNIGQYKENSNPPSQ